MNEKNKGDFELLDELAACAAEKKYPIYRLAMYKDGELRERELIPAPECVALYSVSKNFITAACGMAIDDGAISYDTTVWELFHEKKPYLNEIWKKVTLETVLSQTTGQGGMFLDIDCGDAFSWEADWLDSVLKIPFAAEPGERFAYTDSNFYIASRMLSASIGMTASEFLSHRLFERMKMQGWAWACCPMGYAVGGSGLYLRCRDMAKFGAMMLSHGEFEGERYLSEDFCRRALSPISHPDENTDYGLSFWLPKGEKKCAFRCSGMNNQVIWGSKNDGFAIAWQAYDPSGSADREFTGILNR
jgi:CubicO group peptidase (beta-lactamase class C family)